ETNPNVAEIAAKLQKAEQSLQIAIRNAKHLSVTSMTQRLEQLRLKIASTKKRTKNIIAKQSRINEEVKVLADKESSVKMMEADVWEIKKTIVT
ncbi:hypothetical protein ACFL54_09140, partial [Planctomycetota bacterium]